MAVFKGPRFTSELAQSVFGDGDFFEGRIFLGLFFYWVSLLFNVGEFWEDWERPLQWKGRVCSGRRAGPPDYHSPELVFLYFCTVVFLFSCILVFEYVLVIYSLIINYYNYHRFRFLFYLTGQFEKSVPESYGRHFFILYIYQ